MKKHAEGSKEEKLALNASDLKIKKRKKRKKIIIATVSVVIALPLAAMGIAAAAFAVYSNNVEIDASLLPTASSLPAFYDKNGARMNYSEDKYVSPDSIPENVEKAFVALEDKRFYSHKGYDLVRIAGAVFNNVKAGKLKEGASTITQQLVKNTHLSQERTLKRKLKEIAIASKLEKQYSKKEILAMYLSVIYFGGGAYGINAASNLYFGKTPDELTLGECATLAGVIKNPSKYSPKNSVFNATERRNVVLDVMRREGCISDDELKLAKEEKLKVKASVEKSGAEKFYIARVIEEVCAALDMTKYQLNNSGLKIYTNYDPAIQTALKSEAAFGGNFESKNVDSAAVVIDNASGAIVAHYSSLPYDVTRQAGSVLKPIAVYAPALDKNIITTATPVTDEPINFGGWTPQNFDNKYYGDVTPREALMRSMNSVAVKIIDYLGTDAAADYLSKMDIYLSEEDKNYGLALGATAKGLKPVMIAGAYAALARGGSYIRPSYIKYVTDGESKLYSNETPESSRVFGKDTAYLTTSMLMDTVKDGTARSLSGLGFEIASKTGTAQKADGKNSDAWNASYTNEHTVIVWHGADSMSEKGGGYPTRHARSIWKSVYADRPAPSAFQVPENIFSAEIDTYSTKINKKVTLANKNTPAKYKTTEVFSVSNLPDSAGSAFDSIPEPEWRAVKSSKTVEIFIERSDAYEYSLTVSDAVGSREIALPPKEDLKNEISVRDMPLSLGGFITYKLKVSFITDEGNEISRFSEKQIYVDGV